MGSGLPGRKDICMKRMVRFFSNENGHGMLEVSMVLGLIAVAIVIALFAARIGRSAIGA